MSHRREETGGPRHSVLHFSRHWEIYQSYREVLEQCKNAALMDLEERHNQREMAIMEKLEHYDITDSCLEQAMTYTEQLVRSCSVG